MKIQPAPDAGVQPHSPDGTYVSYRGDRAQLIVVGAMDVRISVADAAASLALSGYRLVEIHLMKAEQTGGGPAADLAIGRICALRGYLSLIFERSHSVA